MTNEWFRPYKKAVDEYMAETVTTEGNKPEFDILYEEGQVLAVNKPGGLLTQAPPGIDSLEFRVKEFLTKRDQKTGNCYLGIPHRLDRPASGLILFAKNSRAANFLSEQFRGRNIEKQYWSVVEGMVPDEEGTWIDYMRKIPNRPEAELVPPIHPEAREAILHYRVMYRLEQATVLQIELETGRTHQIRLQCSSRGFPILGDSQYGSRIPFGEQFEDERLQSIALHSRRMVFIRPGDRETVELVAPVPPSWHEFLPGENR